MNRELLGELISEAVAMLIIIALGESVAAMYLLYTPSPYQNAYWGVCISWGLAVTIAIYVTASISGTHANPAVTLALAIFRGFPWKKVLPYWGAQIVGAFLGAMIVYQLYGPVIDHYNQVHQLTRNTGGAAGVFFTSPGLAITPMHALGDQVILTAFLVFGIFAITERFNEAAPTANAGALIIGFLVAAIGASMGYLEAWAINPARDFGPRLFAFMAGWGESALPGKDHYWWIPVVGPLIGGGAGATAFQCLIYPFLPTRVRAKQQAALLLNRQHP
ncbi:MAG TPA: MIP/aquaporin family protein [Xylella sp.]